jgi:Ca2+:H+ antiporter
LNDKFNKETPPTRRTALLTLLFFVEAGDENGTKMNKAYSWSVLDALKKEAGLIGGFVTLTIFFVFGGGWLSSMSGWITPLLYFCWLFPIMLWLSFGVVHHADCLAIKLGEPYGTLILTLSVISIEVVMISAVMLNAEQNPELGRDMMFAVLMIALNGLVGLSLLCGGIRHLEQEHNLQGANTFLLVLIPNFTQSSESGTFSTAQMVFAGLTSAGLYGAFLVMQTLRHRGFFKSPIESLNNEHLHDDIAVHSVGFHVALLVANMLPIVLLSKSMAKIIDFQVSVFAAPAALGGVVIALLVLAPEGLAAIKAAVSNRLQRSINICLGSAIATIGLTVPAVLMIGLVTGQKVVLGLGPVDSLILVTTILTAMVTFSSSKTNIIHGIVHLILFAAYIKMVFDQPI